jgi:anti-sigma factor RsiW
MSCSQAKRLFGAYWDDDTTRAEREFLESHFASCSSCRTEYEEYSRALEWVSDLPRAEVAPDLAERALNRARRATTVPDHVPAAGLPWVPLTAAAALLVVTATLVAPWLTRGTGSRVAERKGEPQVAVREPERVTPQATVQRTGSPAGEAALAKDPLAGVPDSLFDHGEDVEFILDPVTLRRGRASLTRTPAGGQGDRAIITF